MKKNLRFIMFTLLCAVASVAWGDEVTDKITATNLAATGTSYTDFRDVKINTAVYAGQSAKDSNGAIQLRSKNSNSGIVSTTSGGKVKSVKITVSSGSNTIDVYGNNTAYTSATDLYATSTGGNQGTKLGSLTATGTITVTDDYEYVGIRSNNGAIYISSIEITWVTDGTTTVASPSFSPADGTTFYDSQEITISSTAGATIYYTTDGNEPTTSSTVYTAPFTITETTTVKAFAVKDGMNNSSVASATYTKVVDYATLPFTFNGGKNSLPSGLTQEGLGSDYNSSPYLKFDDTGDWLILKINERPGKLTFDIKGNSFSQSSTSTFKVQTSIDGTTYTDLKAYTVLSSTQSEEFTGLDENVRYIKWIYDEKGATNGGNVALGNISLTKYGEENSYILTISDNAHAEIFAFDEADQTEQILSGSNVQAGTTILLSVDVQSGYQLQSVSVVDEDNLPVTLTEDAESGTYTFTMPESPVTVSCTVLELGSGKIYEKVTTLRNGTYLIVYETGSLAFDGSLTTLDGVGNSIPVNISNDQISGNATIDAATFTYDKKTGTLKSASGYYIGRTTEENGLDASTSTAYVNTISFDSEGNANITSSGGGYLRYNPSSGQTRFRYFKSSSSVQTPIQLYRLVDPESIDAVSISSVGYASLYYSSVNLTVPTGVTAYTYTLDSDNNPIISTTYNAGDVIPEGEGVILKGAAGSYQFGVSTTVPASDANNKLKGSDIAETTTGPSGETSGYLFYVLSTDTEGANPGFYWGANDGAAFESIAHKVYLPIPSGSGSNPAPSYSFDGMNGINEAIVSQETNEGVYTISGVKVQSDHLQKGLYIINGKKVVIK